MKDEIECLEMAIKALEQRWIPVSERLPKERDWYLAVFKESDTGFQLIELLIISVEVKINGS